MSACSSKNKTFGYNQRITTGQQNMRDTSNNNCIKATFQNIVPLSAAKEEATV